MIHNVDIDWVGGVAFNINADKHTITVDAPIESGGENRGIRPKMLILASLGGCTGVDIVSILHKMKVNLTGLKIAVEGTLTEDHPKVYESIILKYIFSGKELEKTKLQKAIELSQKKYCGVTAMLRNSVKISYEIVIEESIHTSNSDK